MSTTSARFDEVVQANGPDLYAYLARRISEQTEVGDALSEVYTTAWRRRAKLPADDAEARMWLYGIAANVLRNLHRGHRRHRSMLGRLREEAEIAEIAQGAGVADTVQDAIARLPPSQAELVRLRHWEGFTLNEAAQIVGIPASTARSRYAAAREQLRQLLSHQGQDAQR